MRNVNYCIQPNAENIWKTPKEVAEHNAKATIPNSPNIIGPQGNECYNDRCFRIHLKGTRYKQTPPATQEPSTTSRTTNQQQALIGIQNLAYNHTPPLLTLPTQHATATHPVPSPTHYQLNQTAVPLYPNPTPLHAIPYTTSLSSTPSQSLHPPQTSAFALQTHYPTFPHIIIPPQSHTLHQNTQDGYQRTTQMGTIVNDHNTFLWEVMHNVQQQLN